MRSHYDMPRSAVVPYRHPAALAGTDEQDKAAMGGVVKLALAAGVLYVALKMFKQEIRETKRA
jgi:hypothetical protein